MKIALCLYGQPRNLYQGYENIKREILDKYDTDVFLHAWSTDKNYITSQWRPIDTEPSNINDIIKLYNPVKYIFNSPMIFDCDTSLPGYQNTPHKSNINNILSQFYSRKSVRDLLCLNNKYDFVIMIRYDIIIKKLPNLFEIDKNKLYFAPDHPERPYVFNDNIIILSLNNFINLMNIDIHDCNKNGVILNAEDILSYNLYKNNLLINCIKTNDILISLINKGGIPQNNI